MGLFLISIEIVLLVSLIILVGCPFYISVWTSSRSKGNKWIITCLIMVMQILASICSIQRTYFLIL